MIFLEFSSDGSDEVSADWVIPEKKERKKKERKINTNERKKKSSPAPVVSDVDSCGERLPLKGLRKVTILYVFFFLVAAPPDGQHKKIKKQLV